MSRPHKYNLIGISGEHENLPGIRILIKKSPCESNMESDFNPQISHMGEEVGEGACFYC